MCERAILKFRSWQPRHCMRLRESETIKNTYIFIWLHSFSNMMLKYVGAFSQFQISVKWNVTQRTSFHFVVKMFCQRRRARDSWSHKDESRLKVCTQGLQNMSTLRQKIWAQQTRIPSLTKQDIQSRMLHQTRQVEQNVAFISGLVGQFISKSLRSDFDYLRFPCP